MHQIQALLSNPKHRVKKEATREDIVQNEEFACIACEMENGDEEDK